MRSAERAIDREDVPVQRTAGGDAHGRHEVDLFGREGVQAPVGDVLQRRSLVGRHLFAERKHLAPVGVPRADGASVAIGVGAGLGRGEPQSSRGEGVSEQCTHGGDLVVGRHLFAALGAHDLAPQGAVPHQEPGVHAESALERVEVLPEGRPVPRHALLQGGEGHPLDLGHHLADVVRVLGIDGGQREPAVAPDDGRHAVHVGGGGQGVPEQLRVVVRVRVDDTRDHGEPAGVEFGGPRLVDLPDGDDPALADSDVGQPAGLPGPVDDRAGSDDVVEHETSGSGHVRLLPDAESESDGPSAYCREPALHQKSQLERVNGPRRRFCTKGVVAPRSPSPPPHLACTGQSQVARCRPTRGTPRFRQAADAPRVGGT